MIELFVRNENLDIIGEISDYDNLTIERNYTTFSKLVLRLPRNRNTIELLKVGNILSDKEDYEMGYVIEHFSSLYEDGEDVLEVYAYSLNRYLDRRVIYNQMRFSGDATRVIENFVRYNCIEVADDRVINGLTIMNNPLLGVTIDSSRSGGTVAEQCYLIANSIGASYDINITNNNLSLRVWKGVDRTIATNEPVIFSRSFDNVLQQNYFNSLLDMKNVAVVAGEGEGANRTVLEVNPDNYSGLQRRELYVDARDLSKTYRDESNEEVTLTDSEYNELLFNRGIEKLNEKKAITTFEATIDEVQYILGRDYFLGDIVTFLDRDLNIQADFRINKIKITSNRQGVRRVPSFGSGIPNKLIQE